MNLYVDLNSIVSLQSDLHTLTGAVVCIYDSRGRVISFYPRGQHSEICKMVRATPLGFKRCNACDLAAFATARKKNGIHIYKCHAGLTEAVLPLIQNNEVLCYVLLGQFLDSTLSMDQNVALIQDSCKDFISLIGNEQIIRSMPTLNNKEINACFHIMESMISMQRMISPQFDEDFRAVKNYIKDHISEEINTNSLSTTLRMSTKRIRSCVLRNSAASVGDYIQGMRTEKAKEYLQNTDMAIYEIAAACGISDYNYFTRLFKKRQGISPQKYRKAFRL